MARRLAREGWSVLSVDVEPVEDDWRHFHCDLSRQEDVEVLVHRVLGEVDELQGLVNNAGRTLVKPPAALELEEWNSVLSLNLTAPFLLSRGLAPRLAGGPGAVVNIASTRAMMSEPHTEAYSASKGGLVALTHAMAMSLAPVRVNCVSPGWIDVQGEPLRPEDHAQHPVGRVGRPEDVAALVSYLLSPDAAFVTGANLVIDGGMTRKMIYAEEP